MIDEELLIIRRGLLDECLGSGTSSCLLVEEAWLLKILVLDTPFFKKRIRLLQTERI